MEIKTRRIGEVLVVEITGRMDTQSSGPASEEMARIVEAGNGKILLNLQDLEFISSAGLRVLLRTTKLLPDTEGKMIICQVKGVVKEVLEISGFDTFIDVYDTEAAALEAF
jgi:anti-sigma B factor antagonist|tara:strand:+ start:228 stop:560 length:333 start_codon:yes stop_codon:yes gene_type:complete